MKRFWTRYFYPFFFVASVLAAQSAGTLAPSGEVRTALRLTTNGDGVGPHWTAITSGLPTRTFGITALTVDPATPTTLYACTSRGDIFKSTDGAASWALVGGVGGVSSLTIDPQNSSTLYATGVGILKSADGGKHWASIAGLKNTSVLKLLVDPITPSTLYALTNSEIFKSTDDGDTWDVKSIPLAQGDFFQSVTLDPTNPSILYAVDGYGAIFKTSNGGEDWSTILPGSSDGYVTHGVSLAIDPATPSSIYAYRGSFVWDGTSIWKSTDGGANWKAIRNGVPDYILVTSLVVDPVTPSTIYAGYEKADASYTIYTGGILKSVDAGASWNVVSSLASTGFLDIALAIDPSTPTKIYAGYIDNGNQTGGVLKSSDGGQSWNAAGAGLVSVDVQFLTPDPLSGSTIYTGGSGGLFRSVDTGTTWTQAGAFPLYSKQTIRSLLIDPTNAQTLFVETSNIDGSCGFSEGLFLKSTDGGGSWRDVSPPESGCLLGSLAGYPPPVALSASDPATLYIAETDDVDEIYQLRRSADGGATWSPWGSGFPSGVAAMAIDATVPTTIYAGLGATPTGVGILFKSTDGGATWNSIGVGNFAKNVLAIDPTNSSVLYAGGSSGLFKSADDGATWSAINKGLGCLLDMHCHLTTLVLDPANSRVLYAGTADAGVFVSSDSGANWNQLNDGLDNLDIRTLAVSPSGLVYAGTDTGAFKLVTRKLHR